MNIEDFNIVEERLENMSVGLHPVDDDIELLIEFYNQTSIKVLYSTVRKEAEYLIAYDYDQSKEISIDIFDIMSITPSFYHYPPRKNDL